MSSMTSPQADRGVGRSEHGVVQCQPLVLVAVVVELEHRRAVGADQLGAGRTGQHVRRREVDTHLVGPTDGAERPWGGQVPPM